ncbi:MAG: beta-propeller domain-containing protein [Candidatus Aenigmatarchaeota archaeon]|nr:beta-propeller domain-containing protein [Candidatus Aenigmarchaeota archaeon]
MKKYIILFSIVFLVVLSFLIIQKNSGVKTNVKTFANYEELENFIKSSAIMAPPRYYALMNSQLAVKSESTVDYSKTNIQVEGVDEADIVKTDGKYIYAVKNQKVFITEAYPAEDLKIVSVIDMKDYPQQIFIYDDKLVVFGQKMYDYSILPYFSISKTFVNIYDISNKNEPKLEKEITLTGSYFQSRMIDNYIYVIISDPVYYQPPRPIPLPMISSGDETRTIQPKEIYYFGYPDNSYSYTTILSINLDNLDYNSKTFLIGNTQTLYVSKDNIYLTYTKHISEYEVSKRFIKEVVIPNLPNEVAAKVESKNFDDYNEFYEAVRIIDEYIYSLNEKDESEFITRIQKESDDFYNKISIDNQQTIINKLSIENGNVELVSSGQVPGSVLNQFSMDEYEGNFRVATTVYGFEQSKNNVYVLDQNLNVIGKIEGIAEGERIYSVRFINDKAYVVTFKQIDPFFVIDLSDPSNPEVLGYLKLPGVSDYLHPYDETHLIGFGRDIDEQGRVKGLKISIFDVSSVDNPVEISNYIVKGEYTYSEALYEHKAFLFSKEKNLLVIPATINEGRFYPLNSWSGLLVFNISLDDIKMKGRITHDGYYYQIRSLYIGDVLYSISESYIKANSIDDLSEIDQVQLGNAVYPLKVTSK